MLSAAKQVPKEAERGVRLQPLLVVGIPLLEPFRLRPEEERVVAQVMYVSNIGLQDICIVQKGCNISCSAL